jgi:hypothetical protein
VQPFFQMSVPIIAYPYNCHEGFTVCSNKRCKKYCVNFSLHQRGMLAYVINDHAAAATEVRQEK